MENEEMYNSARCCDRGERGTFSFASGATTREQQHGNYVSTRTMNTACGSAREDRDLICSPAGTSAERSAVGHRRADIPLSKRMRLLMK